MNIAVVGAGIVGICTAYELARDGHEVTVFERRGAAAEEASFANAGVLAPGYVTPWAAPGMPWKVFKQMLGAHSALRINTPLSATELAWLWHFWRACNPQTYSAHRRALQQLAFYSRSLRQATIERHGLQIDGAKGYLVALRSDKEVAQAQVGLQMLAEAGVVHALIDEAAARVIEPAINADARFAGAIHLPEDEVGNCRQFALLLKDECRRMGVAFEFYTEVQKIESNRHMAGKESARNATLLISNNSSDSQLSSRMTSSMDSIKSSDPTVREETFDTAVLCTGAHSARLLAPLGIKLPLIPVYGYSVSCQIKEPLYAPRSGLMDERYKATITRLGQRVRVAGSAQVGGRAGVMNQAALNTLYQVLHDWFPGAAILSRGVQQWQGARPMLANRPPVIGASAQPGIWLNLGHGSSGWALAPGSARLLADLIAGRGSEIPAAAYALSASA